MWVGYKRAQECFVGLSQASHGGQNACFFNSEL